MVGPLRFSLLGSVRAWLGESELALGPAKQRAVLAILLLNANRPVPVSSIVDAVWGDSPPANGSNVVQKHVAGLRRILEPARPARAPGSVLTLSDAGYVLHVAPDAVDSERVGAQLRAAADARRAGRAGEAATALRELLDGWPEPPLAGLAGAYFDGERARLTAQRADAAELWAETSLDLGRHERVVAEIPELVAEFPARERLRAALMLALYHGGRQAEALAVYQGARQHLVGEYGVEPGPELRDLHGRILRNDPSLLPPPAPPSPAAPVAAVAAGPVSLPGGPWRPADLAACGSGRPAGWGGRLRLAGGLLAALLCMASFGLITWIVVALYAAYRRSPRLAWAAVGYAVLGVGWVLLVPLDPVPYFHLRMIGGLLAILLCAVGGGAHVGYLAVRPRLG